jgi:alkanesulfonate monooxygenase SsuD/methylene tetrahydromethanopterin reductase-like flavin-dependent oxidoreductase (luciferase family)
MKFGFVFPGGDARTAAKAAREAEFAGWNGFFVWDSVWDVDPWVSLTAAAMLTSHIRLGTMLTPISRRRPWKLAGEDSSQATSIVRPFAEAGVTWWLEAMWDPPA